MKRSYILLFSATVFFITFATYIITINSKFDFIDSGELICVCKTLGIAHPTGYPLYTMVGRIISLITIKNLAFRINTISALFSSLACLFLFLFLNRKGNRPFLSLSISLLFGYSQIVWQQSTSAEVYSMTFFFITFILFLHTWRIKNRLLLIAFFSGLSISNHMIIVVFLIPFFIYMAVCKELNGVKKFLLFSLFFILGISIYVYLPIRSSIEPLFNWGKPVNFERFLWHITGKQYKVWMFTGNIMVIKRAFASFLKFISSQYTPLFIPLALLGVIGLFSTSKPKAIFFLSLFILNIIYAINYEIPDIEPYFIVSILVYTIFIHYGLLFLAKRIKQLTKVSLILPFLVLLYNFKGSNERGNYVAYDMCCNLFASVNNNGIVITNNWDYYSPSLYLRYIEDKRKDIVIIDKELLRRSWYFDYLKREYPHLMRKSKHEIEMYLELLYDFEHSNLESAGEIQECYIRMINSFIEKNIEKYPCYITFADGGDRDSPSIVPDLMKIPHGIVYKITNEPDTTFFDYSKFRLRGLFNGIYFDDRTLNNIKVYPRMSMQRGIHLLKMGQYRSALKTFEFAEKWELTETPATSFQAVCYLFIGKTDSALSLFKETMKHKPEDKILRQAVMMIEEGKTDQLKQVFSDLLGIQQN
jgi:tetratricopeptide (TPR) repeat protein